MSGIHAVLTPPTEIEVAVWDPEDMIQSGLVLDWLTQFFGDDLLWPEDGADGGLYLNFATGRTLYVPAGTVIGIKPLTREIGVYSQQQVEDGFTYSHPLVDPGQPSLFDLDVTVMELLDLLDRIFDA